MTVLAYVVKCFFYLAGVILLWKLIIGIYSGRLFDRVKRALKAL